MRPTAKPIWQSYKIGNSIGTTKYKNIYALGVFKNDWRHGYVHPFDSIDGSGREAFRFCFSFITATKLWNKDSTNCTQTRRCRFSQFNPGFHIPYFSFENWKEERKTTTTTTMVTKNLISVALSLVVLTVASVASNVDVDVLPTPQNSNSIHTIIESQKRYVLFNSRRLSGDCRKYMWFVCPFRFDSVYWKRLCCCIVACFRIIRYHY